MNIRLLSKNNLKKIIDADPTQHIFSTTKYYHPLFKKLYLKRVKLALRMLPTTSELLLDIGFGGGIILPLALGTRQMNDFPHPLVPFPPLTR